MSDAPLFNESEPYQGERDFAKEFDDAAQIGRMALRVAKERTEHKYSFPYLDPQRFAQSDVEALGVVSGTPASADAVKRARKASVALAIESAAQIAEAQTPLTVNDELDSLESIFILLNRGHGFTIQVEAQDPQAVISSCREAIARRQGIQPELIRMTDAELKQWAYDNFQRATQRIGKGVRSLREYFGS